MKSPEFNWSFPEPGWCPGCPGSQKASFPQRRRGASPRGRKVGWLSWHGCNPGDARVLLETEQSRAGWLHSCLDPTVLLAVLVRGEAWGGCGGAQGAHRVQFSQTVWFQKFAVKLLVSIREHIPTFLLYNLSLKPTALIFSVFTSLWKLSKQLFLLVCSNSMPPISQ